MPELPEVQSFALALDAAYAGKVLAGISLHRPGLRYPFSGPTLAGVFAPGSLLTRVERVGKQLLLTTDRGKVRVSLGMSGSFFAASVDARRKHEHVTLHFSDGTSLGYEDARRFGFWIVEGDGATAPMSPDAVDATDASALLRVFQGDRVFRSPRSVKDLLMDQRAIAGIGNIYALEALFRVRLHPATSCSRIRPEGWRALAEAIPPLLETAIAHGGSSISTYRRLHGENGGFQALHLVYGREGEACLAPGCKGIVERIVQGGRSSFLCRKCQRPPR